MLFHNYRYTCDLIMYIIQNTQQAHNGIAMSEATMVYPPLCKSISTEMTADELHKRLQVTPSLMRDIHNSMCPQFFRFYQELNSFKS